jgi:hypothetical protein
LLSFVNTLLVMLLLPLLLRLLLRLLLLPLLLQKNSWLTVLCWLLPVLVRHVQLLQPAAR